MLPETSLLLFLTTSVALIAAPGPDNLYIVTRGVAQGRKAALISTLGMGLGVLVHTTFAAVGLSALLAQSATAFSVVKYAGAAYLVYLGVKTILDKGSIFVPQHGTPVTLKSVFWQAVISDVLNPKVALFFLAFLPQFVSPGVGGVAAQLFALGVLFALIGLVIDGVIAYFSGGVGNWLRSKPGAADALRWLTGSVLVGLGLRLALPERR